MPLSRTFTGVLSRRTVTVSPSETPITLPVNSSAVETETQDKSTSPKIEPPFSLPLLHENFYSKEPRTDSRRIPRRDIPISEP